MILKGFVLGLSIAAPVGPIGLLCIRRSMFQGWRCGFASGLGAATADACYGAIAALGLTMITHRLVAMQYWLALIGGAFLVYLGVTTFLSSPVHSESLANDAQERGLLGAYISTLGLTLANPMTILSFVAIYAGLGLDTVSGQLRALWVVLGVFLGSASWWLALSTGAHLFAGKTNHTVLHWVNRISGFVIGGFGCAALVSAISAMIQVR